MRLKYAYEVMKLDDQAFAVPLDAPQEAASCVIKLNETAALILDCLKVDVTEAEIVDRLAGEYSAPRDVLAADVRRCLDSFSQRGLLV